MINAADRGIIIDGVTLIEDVAGFYGIAEDGKPYPIKGLLIADGQGSAVEAAAYGAIRIDGEVNYVLLATLTMASGWEFDVTGTVYPVGSTVYLMDGLFDRRDLTSEQLAYAIANYDRRTRSDETDGYFQFNGLTTAAYGVTLFALAPVGAALSSGLNFSLTAEKTVYGKVDDEGGGSGGSGDDPIEVGGEIETREFFSSPTNSSAQSWNSIFEGYATPGMGIYLSNGTGYTAEELMTTLVGSTTAHEQNPDPDYGDTEEQGHFYIDTGNLYSASFYTLWNYTKDGHIDDAWMYNSEHICLSGDTLITMADGSRRRLDALKVGELVRAGDGTATAITRLARGVFRPTHTLYQFSDGALIDAPHDHRFFNREQGFFQYLSRWQLGEHAMREDGTEAALEEITLIHERAELFGIWTGSHDYWANGLLSGETGANQRFIATATAEQAAEMAASLIDDTALKLLGLEDFYP